jgi:hypothetical protein
MIKQNYIFPFTVHFLHPKTIVSQKGAHKTRPSDINAMKQTINQCTKIGDDGESIMVSVITEESHEGVVSGKLDGHLVSHTHFPLCCSNMVYVHVVGARL